MFRDLSFRIIKNIGAVYRGRNLVWHALAILLTAVIVLSDADWWFFEHTRSDALHPLIWAAGIGGFFVPVLVPVILYYWGEFKRSRYVMNLGAAVAQAEMIAYLVTIIYKIFTGRTQPEFLTHYSNVDITRDFHFGIWQNGIFWGWPSSHAAVAFAGSFVIIFLTRRTSVRMAAVLYACLVSMGAAVGFHWLSDVIAGSIVGILVASIVSASFKNKA